MARQVVVEIIGDSKQFTKSLDEAGKTASRFGGVVSGIGLGIGAKAFDLAADAVSNFVGQLGAAQQAYRDDQVSQATLRQVLQNTVPAWNGSTDAIEAYASSQAALGFQDDDIRASIGQLVGITHDQTKAMELNTLAQDLARAKGIDLAQATDVVTKAAQGNGKALKGLGIDVSDATTAADFLKAAQDNVKGSAEAWAATSEGKAAVANVKNSESWEKIGGVVDRISQVILPVAADLFSGLADIIVGVSDAVEPLVSDIATQLQPVLQTVSKYIRETVIPVMSKIAEAVLPPLRSGLEIAGKVFGTVFGAISTVVSTEIGIVSRVIGGVIGVFNGITSTIRDVQKNVSDAVTNIVGFFSGIGTKIGNATKGMWDGVWDAFKSVINTVIRGWNSLRFTMPEVDLGPLGKVGGFTIGTPNIPLLHTGGIVPGTPGTDVLAMLQAGERVLPSGSDGPARTINVNLSVTVSSPDGTVSELDAAQVSSMLQSSDLVRALEHMAAAV